jgi:cell division septum initiation protein DivIVA
MANASRVVASLSRACHRASRVATGARDASDARVDDARLDDARLDRASNRTRDRFESIV